MSEAALLPRRQDGETRKRSALNRLIWAIVVVLIFVAILELIFAIFISPNLTLKHIEVESDFTLSERELLTVAGIGRNEYYFSIDCEAIRSRLAAYAVVRSVQVAKVFPDTLRLVLKRRRPLALTFGEGEKNPTPVAFDKEGVVFQIGKQAANLRLPLISGLTFKASLGLRLPGMLDEFLAELSRLQEKAPALFEAISEIKVVSVNEIDYELIFYPMGYNMRINLGDRFNENILKYSIMTLDVLEQQGLLGKVKELDFRTGEVIYRLAGQEE